MRNLAIFIFTISMLGLTGCGHRAFVKGDYDKDVNAENLLTDKWSETDMQKAVKDLVASAVVHPSISNAKRVPIVMVTKLQNKTSEHIETESVTDMISTELMKTGKVTFVDKAAREDMAEEYEYQQENASRESRKSKGNQTGADLIMNGALDSIVQEAGKDKTVYYKLTLKMTNLSSGLIVWQDHKQIRKIYRKQHVGL